MGVVAKRSTMMFFSNERDHYCHRVRIVLAEKGVTADVIEVNPEELPLQLSELNPYNSLPTLVDRELTIYDTRVMMEYLDERFPHPPLLPVYPVTRAEIRQYMYRVEVDWCPLLDTLLAKGKSDKRPAARQELLTSLVAIAPIFMEKPFFMSDEFTLVDCSLAAILWRLPSIDMDIPATRQTAPLLAYMKRVFQRESFVASLTPWEAELGKLHKVDVGL